MRFLLDRFFLPYDRKLSVKSLKFSEKLDFSDLMTTHILLLS